MKISSEIKEKLQAAYQIALRDLRACYDKKGIVAGRLHFDDYWARDSFWASFGALAAGDFSIVKKNLYLFSRKQHRNGQIPLKIGRFKQFWNFVGIKKRLEEEEESLFRLVERAGHPLDPTALFIIVAEEYFQKTRDTKVLKKLFSPLKKAAQWLTDQDHDHDDLVESGFLSDWMDSVLKRGKIFYLNICYWQALKSMAKIYSRLEELNSARKFRAMSELTRQKINQVFWNSHFFWDWVGHGKHGSFASDGNILAGLWELASRSQFLRILKTIKNFHLNQNILRTNHPGYSWKQVTWFHILFGMKNYHNKFIWPWIGTLNSLAKIRFGQIKSGLDDLKIIAEWYIKHNAVYEIYDRNGNPVRKLFYHSEKNFAWNAAMFVYVIDEIGL